MYISFLLYVILIYYITKIGECQGEMGDKTKKHPPECQANLSIDSYIYQKKHHKKENTLVFRQR